MVFFDIFSKSNRVKKKSKSKTIFVDYREKNSLVPSFLMGAGLEVVYKNLSVGDYIVGDLIIERKTIRDLINSIIDKRASSQIKKIQDYDGSVFLIEGFFGNIGMFSEKFNKNALKGFLLSLVLNSKVNVLFSENEKDSADYISLLSRKNSQSNVTLREAKKFGTDRDRARYVLEGFEGIGPKRANLLLDEFGSLKKIFAASEKELEKIIGKNAKNFRGVFEQKFN